MYDYQKKLLNAYCTADTTAVMKMGRQSGKSSTMINWAKTLEEFTQGYRLELSTGKVFGQEYYCVEPKGLVWRNDIEWYEMHKWCEDNLGEQPESITPAYRWYITSGQFWFQTEQDRLMFVLRWS